MTLTFIKSAARPFVLNALFLLLACLASPSLYAQDQAADEVSTIKWSGYVGAYFAWDNDKGQNPRQLSFIAPNREEFGLDIAMISFEYAGEKTRAKATIQYGDVVRGWSSINQDAVLNRGNIQEAYAGFRVMEGLWIDAGFFLTHVGMEGFFPKDNFLSTLAITTLYEPFGQAGARVTYQFSDDLTGQFNLLNGFSTLTSDQPANASPRAQAFGLQLSYRISESIRFVYDNVIGEVNQGQDFRTYHNFYLSYSENNLQANVGLDFATQNNTPTSGNTSTYFSVLFEARYALNELIRVMGRAEYFNDNNGVLTVEQFQFAGLTLGADIRPTKNGFFRVESRYLNSLGDENRFNRNASTNLFTSKNRIEVIFTTGVYF